MCTLADQFKEARQVSIVLIVSSSRKETPFEQKNAVAGKDQRNQKEQTSKNEGQQSHHRTEQNPEEMVVATSVLDQAI